MTPCSSVITAWLLGSRPVGWHGNVIASVTCRYCEGGPQPAAGHTGTPGSGMSGLTGQGFVGHAGRTVDPDGQGGPTAVPGQLTYERSAERGPSSRE